MNDPHEAAKGGERIAETLPPQLTDLMNQSRNTLDALRRGETPPCPCCGSACTGKYDHWFLNGEAIWKFACGSNVQRVMRSDTCYERQLAQQAAEIERLVKLCDAQQKQLTGTTVAEFDKFSADIYWAKKHWEDAQDEIKNLRKAMGDAAALCLVKDWNEAFNTLTDALGGGK